MMRSCTLHKLKTTITLTASALITVTSGAPTDAERMSAIEAATDRIAQLIQRRRDEDQSEIERDAAIIVANLSGIIANGCKH